MEQRLITHHKQHPGAGKCCVRTMRQRLVHAGVATARKGTISPCDNRAHVQDCVSQPACVERAAAVGQAGPFAQLPGAHPLPGRDAGAPAQPARPRGHRSGAEGLWGRGAAGAPGLDAHVCRPVPAVQPEGARAPVPARTPAQAQRFTHGPPPRWLSLTRRSTRPCLHTPSCTRCQRSECYSCDRLPCVRLGMCVADLTRLQCNGTPCGMAPSCPAPSALTC